jgi:CRP-like cAMP-binding protein
MASHRNSLLASLMIKDFGLLEPHLQPVTLGFRKILEKPNKRIEAVYFPESGFASVVAVQSSKTQVEVGLIGRERMTDVAIVLGNHQTPHSTYVQAAGTGQCIPADDLRQAIRASLSLRDLDKVRDCVRRADNSYGDLQREFPNGSAVGALAAQDRIGTDVLPLTHEFLALMLAVHRPGVTAALIALKKQRLIVYRRGNITITDRKALERTAGASYGVPKASTVG